MFIMTAETAVRQFDKNGNPKADTEFLLSNIRAGREHNNLNFDVLLTPAALADATQYARDVCGVDFSEEQISLILELYPTERIDIAVHSLRDTMTRDSFAGVLAHYLLGSSWPNYGDNVDIAEFQVLLERQAQKLGYKLTPPSA
jgi:hypothetical protein